MRGKSILAGFLALFAAAGGLSLPVTAQSVKYAAPETVSAFNSLDGVNSVQEAVLKAKAKKIIAGIITPGMTDYEKEKTIHDYITRNAVYDIVNYYKGTIPAVDGTAYGILVNGIGVCEGFAEAFQYLLDMVNISCKVVVGKANAVTYPDHAWNVVRIGGSWYDVDVTWDQNTYSTKYFDIDDAELSHDHSWSSSNYPSCTNHFVVNRGELVKYCDDSSSASVSVPAGVTSIGASAFSGCTGLKSVTLPDSVKSIAEDAFSGCSGLAKINIPASVKDIGNGAFNNCPALTSITLPSGISEVNDKTFMACTSLTSVTLPNSIRRIGCDAFNNCPALTSVTLPEGVTEIDDGAFAGCDALAQFNVPNSVESIGREALPNLWMDAKLGNATTSFLTAGDGVLIAYLGESGDITVPDGVKSIGNGAFGSRSDCVTAVSLPQSVTKIEGGAFEDCTGLKSFSVPVSVKTIGAYAFNGCTNLTDITIPQSVADIGENAFGDTPWLKSQKGDCVVAGDGILVAYKGTGAGASVPAGVKRIGDGAFEEKSDLRYVSIPSGVTSVGKKAFLDSGLESVALPNGVTNVGADAFSGCTGLKVVSLPKSVTEIGADAFETDDVIIYAFSPTVYAPTGSAAANYLLQIGAYCIPAAKPAPLANLDYPYSIVKSSGTVTVTGWALSADGLSRIDVYADGKTYLGTVWEKQCTERIDVEAVHGADGYANLTKCGYSLTIQEKKLKTGRNILRAALVDKLGHVTWSNGISVFQ